MKPYYTIILLIFSNVLMTIAWYAHLKFTKIPFFSSLGLFGIILFGWCVAFLEYCLLIPANKYGYIGNGGSFDIWQLKVMQEVITLSVFSVFALLIFKSEAFRINHIISFVFLVLAVYFMFKK